MRRLRIRGPDTISCFPNDSAADSSRGMEGAASEEKALVSDGGQGKKGSEAEATSTIERVRAQFTDHS